MSVERYVMRPVAHDVIKFDGTYESALEIAEWIGSAFDPEFIHLLAVNEKNAFLGVSVQTVILNWDQIGMFGVPMTVPLLMWGFTDEGEKGKPLTMNVANKGTTAYPGYFVVRTGAHTFTAVSPKKFKETYRKQKAK